MKRKLSEESSWSGADGRNQNKQNLPAKRTPQGGRGQTTCGSEIWHVWQALHQNVPELSLESQMGQTVSKVSQQSGWKIPINAELSTGKCSPGRLPFQSPDCSQCSTTGLSLAFFTGIVVFHWWGTGQLQSCFPGVDLTCAVRSNRMDLLWSNFKTNRTEKVDTST